MAPVLDRASDHFCWKRLLSLVPSSLVSSTSAGKRFLRCIEGFINYFIIWIYVLIKRPDIIHFQWLPFLEFSNIEYFLISSLRITSNNSKLFLTVHNLYPHDSSDIEKVRYKKRFMSISKLFDGYMVHLQSVKERLCSDFVIDEEKVFVTYHGIFEGNKKINILRKNSSDDVVRIIMYGIQTEYKGADILMDALELLPKEYLEKTKTLIVGRTEEKLFSRYENKTSKLNVTWINRFVSEDELYSSIAESDLILLPYRAITQSGVLLLALSYGIPILTSDLPSFKETLSDYTDDCFFESNNPHALADILKRFIDCEIDRDGLCNIIKNLNRKYSWSETANSTINAYKSRMKNS